jgi:hypothetical protein
VWQHCKVRPVLCELVSACCERCIVCVVCIVQYSYDVVVVVCIPCVYTVWCVVTKCGISMMLLYQQNCVRLHCKHAHSHKLSRALC